MAAFRGRRVPAPAPVMVRPHLDFGANAAPAEAHRAQAGSHVAPGPAAQRRRWPLAVTAPVAPSTEISES